MEQKKNSDELPSISAFHHRRTGLCCLKLQVGELKIPSLAIIDSGAAENLIEKDLFVQAEGKVINPEMQALGSVSQAPIPNEGIGEIVIDVGRGPETIKCVIIPHTLTLPTPVLLGLEYMFERRVSISPLQDEEGKKSLMLTFNDSQVTTEEAPDECVGIYPLWLGVEKEGQPMTPVEGREKKYKVRVAKETWLAPGMLGYIELEIQKGLNRGIFDPDVTNPCGKLLYPGVVGCVVSLDGTKSKFVVPYANPYSESLYVNSDTFLGHFSPCDFVQYNETQPNVCSVSAYANEEKNKKLEELVDSLFSPGSKEHATLSVLTKKYPQVFALEGEPLTITPYYCHTIQLKSPEPIYTKPYPIPIKYHQQIEKQLQELQAHGVIRPSNSPYNSPLIPIAKKDGTLRLCLDFRKLNDNIIDDKHPLPNISTILQQLSESRVFSTLDLKMGYHQVPLSPESTKITAFVTPSGLYEYLSVPFGLKTAAAAYQRIVNSILHGLIGGAAHIYLDDILVTGKNFVDHTHNLERVIERLAEAHMSLRLDKCSFFKDEVSYLGHIISSKGIRPQPEKIKAIMEIPVPKTIKELQSALGIFNYYRKFILGYSNIAHPLNQLLKGQKNEKKDRK